MMTAWSAGDLDGALKQADAVLKLEPRNVAYLFPVGALFCEQAEKANLLTRLSWAGKCHSTWEGALAIDPKNLDIRFALIQFYMKAPSIAGGGADKARQQAQAIAALDATRGEIAWGNIARAEKNPVEAERRYRKAAEIDPTAMRGPVALASFYASDKRWADAKQIFERRLQKDPADGFAMYQLGRLHLAEGVDPSRALPLFDRYLSAPAPPNGPSHADAWFSKGQAFDKLGRKSDAVAAYESALKLVPGHAGAAKELKRLKG